MRKAIPIIGIICILLAGNMNIADDLEEDLPILDIEEQAEDVSGLYAGVSDMINGVVPEERLILSEEKLKESEIYTFLQGPRAWEEKFPWAGEWNQFDIDGNLFGAFGCGLCCMANVYSTLSPYECSPWDMFEHARKVSKYSPDGTSGAIGWKDMKTTLKKVGMECGLYQKPDKYKEFQKQMAHAKSAIVLICSSDDDTYWEDIPGHYVNIWDYQEETDEVFLAEPGNPENNRTRIPLRYVYDALKTVSKYQYLIVEEYQEEENSWKWNEIKEKWNRPK